MGKKRSSFFVQASLTVTNDRRMKGSHEREITHHVQAFEPVPYVNEITIAAPPAMDPWGLSTPSNADHIENSSVPSFSNGTDFFGNPSFRVPFNPSFGLAEGRYPTSNSDMSMMRGGINALQNPNTEGASVNYLTPSGYNPLEFGVGFRDSPWPPDSYENLLSFELPLLSIEHQAAINNRPPEQQAQNFGGNETTFNPMYDIGLYDVLYRSDTGSSYIGGLGPPSAEEMSGVTGNRRSYAGSAYIGYAGSSQNDDLVGFPRYASSYVGSNNSFEDDPLNMFGGSNPSATRSNSRLGTPLPQGDIASVNSTENFGHDDFLRVPDSR
jgi:hypothetical protein